MKLALMNYHYLRYSLKTFLDKAEQSPFEYVDLYCSAPQLDIFNYPLSRLIELEKDLRHRNLEVLTLTPENCVYPVNFCTSDETTRQSSIRYYQRAIDTAEYLGCQYVQISTGFGYFDLPADEAWRNCQESLGILSSYCERKGVTLLLEELKTTTTNVLITSSDLQKMIDEVGSSALLAMLDTDQMTYAGESIDDYFDRLGDSLTYIHFNDRGHTVPGDADFPMKDYYRQIVNHNYNGACSFEICDRRYFRDPDKATDRLVDWLMENTHEFA
jgi:protein FrlC